MVRSVVGVLLAVATALGMASTRGNELGSQIDLTAFGNEAFEKAPVADDVSLQDVALRSGVASRRFYLTGMIGPSFAAVESPASADVASSDTLFNAGGAMGVALERRRGRLRLEVEGMGRSNYSGLEANGSFLTLATNNWSVVANGWRDFMITDRFGIYGGGGIGAGGYALSETDTSGALVVSTDPAAAFAWQAGGGLLWELSDRLTFDVGYRFFQINAMQRPLLSLPDQFIASELMFSLRLYEPFRNWHGGR